jgi:hypothetical protein
MHAENARFMAPYEQDKRDTSSAMIHIDKRSRFNQQKLEEGVRLMEKRRWGLKDAAEKVGVVKGQLKKYWNDNYKHIPDEDDDGSDSDDGAVVPANKNLVGSESDDDDSDEGDESDSE